MCKAMFNAKEAKGGRGVVIYLWASVEGVAIVAHGYLILLRNLAHFRHAPPKSCSCSPSDVGAEARPPSRASRILEISLLRLMSKQHLHYDNCPDSS